MNELTPNHPLEAAPPRIVEAWYTMTGHFDWLFCRSFAGVVPLNGDSGTGRWPCVTSGSYLRRDGRLTAWFRQPRRVRGHANEAGWALALVQVSIPVSLAVIPCAARPRRPAGAGAFLVTGPVEALNAYSWLNAILLLARLGFAAMFVSSAIDKFRADSKEVEMIASLHLPAPQNLERLAGALEALGAVMLVLGIGTRLAAVGLLAFTAFTTLAFLRYWSFQGPPEAKQPVKATFYANWAVSASLLYLAAFGPGRWAFAPGLW